MGKGLKLRLGQQIVYTLLSPALGILMLFKTRNDKLILWGVTLLFGLAGSVFQYVKGTDGLTHLRHVQDAYVSMSLTAFLSELFNIITLNPTGSSTDPYIHVLSFIAGGIFGVPELLHLFAGLVLGFFFSKSFLQVRRYTIGQNLKWWIVGFIILFIAARSITSLNSIRMWTGMWVLFYGSHSFLVKGERKYIIIALSSIFIHFSYIIFTIPVVGAYFIRGRTWLLIFLFASSYLGSLNFAQIERFAPETSLVENKQKLYVREGPEQERNTETATKGSNFYKAYGPSFYFNYVLVGFIILLLIQALKKEIDGEVLFLMASGILLYSLGNWVSFSPSVSGRAHGVSSLFLLSANILALTKLNTLNSNRLIKDKSWFKTVQKILLILAIPYILFHVSYTLNMLSAFFLFFPFVSWLIGVNDVSINEFLKILF